MIEWSKLRVEKLKVAGSSPGESLLPRKPYDAAGGGESLSQTGDDAGDAVVHGDVRNSCPPRGRRESSEEPSQNYLIPLETR